MSTDPGTLPPVPAQYGALDGGPPGTDEPPRVSRRRVKTLGRVDAGPPTGPGYGPSEAPEVEVAPTGASPRVSDRDLPTGPGVSPVGPPGYALEGTPPRLPWRDRREYRREARAAQWPDGYEQYTQRRFGRDKVRVVRGRRSRRIVRRIDTWTVLKVSFLFYLCVLVVVLISGVVLWNVSQAFNFTHDIEKSVKTLFGYNTFTLHPTPMFEYTALGGAVLTIVGTLANLLAAMVYNLIADVVGGIQIVVVSEDA